MSAASSERQAFLEVGLADEVAVGEERGPRDRAGGCVTSQHDGVLEVGQVVAVEHRHVVVAEEAVDGDQDAGPALGEDVGRLSALVPGVDRHDHAARRLQPEQGDDPLVDVGRPDGHAVARADPGGEERPPSLGRPRRPARRTRGGHRRRPRPRRPRSAPPPTAPGPGRCPTRDRRGCRSPSPPPSSALPDGDEVVGGRDGGEERQRVVDDGVGVRRAGSRRPRRGAATTS